MVDSNYYVENQLNRPMHYGDKPIVGAIDFPDRLPVRRPYDYFEAQEMYDRFYRDMQVKEQHANPQTFKKGVPKIIKIAVGSLITLPFVFLGIRGLKNLIAKFRH